MIGQSTNFQHVSHAGFDRDNKFSQFNVDNELQDLFEAVSLRLGTM